MTSPPKGTPLLLPPGTRLFYIGAPKTGSTSLQLAMADARDELADHGVYFPGTRRNHRREVFALMQRADPSMTRPEGGRKAQKQGVAKAEAVQVPPMAEWKALLADIDTTEAPRTLVTHEVAAEASQAQAQQFVEDLGRERTHIAITLRAPATLLPARWLEYLKNGLSEPFNLWAERVYGDNGRAEFKVLWRYLDIAKLVERWAKAAGPENVTVIIVDKNEKGLLTGTFERLLGLPERFLDGRVTDGRTTNRSLSLPEAEVLRGVNEIAYEPTKTSWALYRDVIYSGAINRVLAARSPAADEPRVRVPQWVADRATHDGKQYAERIARSGVRVVGHLETLYEYPAISDGHEQDGDHWYQEVAIQALAGALGGAARTEKNILAQLTRAKKDQKLMAAKRGDIRAKASRKSNIAIHDQIRALTAASRVDTAGRSFTTAELLRGLKVHVQRRVRASISRKRK